MATTKTQAFDGERWDSVAQRAYGDASKVNVLWRANPDIPITDRLVGGTVIIVPVQDAVPVAPSEVLPPWKR